MLNTISDGHLTASPPPSMNQEQLKPDASTLYQRGCHTDLSNIIETTAQTNQLGLTMEDLREPLPPQGCMKGCMRRVKRAGLMAMLRGVVKPIIHHLPLRTSFLNPTRSVLNRLTPAFLHEPKGVSIHTLSFNGRDAEWIVHQEAGSSDKVILYFPGGGHIACSPKTHRALTGYLAKGSGAKVFAIDYRKAPEFPYPAALHDANTAYEHLLDLGYPAENIIIVGDSAGAHLGLSLLFFLKEQGRPLPQAAICLSALTDLTLSGQSLKKNQSSDPLIPVEKLSEVVDRYRGEIPPEDPRVSPLLAEMTGLPPLLIHVGDREVLQDDSLRFAQKAAAARVPVDLKVWQNMPHVFQLFPNFLEESRLAIHDINYFIKMQFVKNNSLRYEG